MTAVLESPGSGDLRSSNAVPQSATADQAVALVAEEPDPIDNQEYVIHGHDGHGHTAGAPGIDRPFHCGSAMALCLAGGTPPQTWISVEPEWPEWTCGCGLRVFAEISDLLGAVLTASARVQTLQLQLEAARAALDHAVHQAVGSGVEHEELALASGLNGPEIETLLQ
ncbi:hypothetical protein [Arthrobacter bambusae]|uniref:hypothetical protein n=1 Tax=Arthrobacter bambusae TaxID=1338426 RepID=UPI00278947F5|nr:hypothetical protein [Arthrobacter bambusae]MDQ0030914.1 hypothetical protein [Arthrobacter bambusae]MDQ0099279.1 hypothetical protein [Arthrobacter bambusae]